MTSQIKYWAPRLKYGSEFFRKRKKAKRNFLFSFRMAKNTTASDKKVRVCEFCSRVGHEQEDCVAKRKIDAIKSSK